MDERHGSGCGVFWYNAMKILGITAEYDPFHNGHTYHLERAKATVSPDATVCVMSGDFTQRGEPAVADKWQRARTALQQGLDLVLELPFLCACSRAERFAAGAVDILAGVGATHIAFGCEAEDPRQLIELAHRQIVAGPQIEELIREEMEKGISHAKARQIVGDRLFGEDLNRLSLTPNNILALEYLKRIRYWQDRGVEIVPVPILREGAGYRDAGASGDVPVAGGSALRQMLRRGEVIDRFLPDAPKAAKDPSAAPADAPELPGGSPEDSDPSATPADAPEAAPGPAGPWIDLAAAEDVLFRQLQGVALRSTPEELKGIYCMGEGLENRLIRELRQADSYDDLLARMTSRRYTTSTIRRLLLYTALGLTGEIADALQDALAPGIRYGRVLAADKAGREVLRDCAPLPVITGINRIDHCAPQVRESLALDVRAADLYALLTKKPIAERSDYRRHPWVAEEEKK